MENSKYKNLESRRTSEVVKDYIKKGYEVILYPQEEQLPDFLKNYQLDILAKKGDENIVIEIKSRETINSSKYLIELANKIENRDDWRFELILTNPRKHNIEYQIPSILIIENKLDNIYQLKSANQIDAAFLISWATFEAATRKILKAEQPNSEIELAPNGLIKQLFSFGIIGKMNYNQLLKISKKRNEIVHGFFNESNSEVEDYIQRLTTLIQDFISELKEKTGHNNV
ncbi:hypothetical protein [Patiriisocius sp. Uisw_017]|uniref:hypothetical protein n=1 Tax=Patiriisocius sp. Uisw_017 TaxID=3230968 RepID=UPI0039ED9A92